jgi:hypothetical protein
VKAAEVPMQRAFGPLGLSWARFAVAASAVEAAQRVW